ncbi:MAG: ribonuclease HII [Cyclobacteriaceae bacterium]|nr:MAG: ribonuclease HII [Cyclobacteriaceae bacterium]
MLKSRFYKSKIEAGCDEAGRGCLAGPVVAAAVILPRNYQHDTLNDSKTLTKNQRINLLDEIKHNALGWAIGIASHQEIDKINILNASYLAMHRAIDKLKRRPQHLLIDGNRFNPYQDIPHRCIVKGDSKYFSIAAASVLAKTFRDGLMEKLSEDHPQYHWHTNVGYPTKAHRSAIRDFGITQYHRRSFQLLPTQLELF